MNSPEIKNDFTKAELKRLIKIIEIQKGYIKRQERLQKLYADFITIHREWQCVFLETLHTEDTCLDHSNENTCLDHSSDLCKQKSRTLPRNINMTHKDEKVEDKIISTEDIVKNSTVENLEENSGMLQKESKEELIFLIEKLENLQNVIKSQNLDLTTITNELNNENSINHGYKMMIKDQHFKLTGIQERLLKKLADITKLIKLLVDGTSQSKHSNLITCLAYIFDIDLPNGNYENVDESVTSNFFQSISQLKWSIESLDVEQVGDMIHMFDLLIDSNDIQDEIQDKLAEINFLEHLTYFKDHILYEYYEDFEEQQIEVAETNIYENIDNIGKTLNGVEEQKAIRLKLQVELVYEQHLKIAKPPELAQKNYDISNNSNSNYGTYLLKPEKAKETEAGYRMTSNFRYLEKDKSDFGFFFKNNHGNVNNPKILHEHSSEVEISKRSHNRPVKVIPVAAVKPLLKVESDKPPLNEATTNKQKTEQISFEENSTRQANNAKENNTTSIISSDVSSFTKKSSSLSKIPDFSSHVEPLVSDNSSFTYNRTFSLPSKNTHKKLCRLSESFSFKPTKKIEASVEPEKSSSLPTNFKKSPFVDWSSIQIDGEVEKTADFRIVNKNHLSVQSLPRKLSFKRRNSGRNFVAIKTL